MITKHGICYDLTLSPYRYKLNGLTYVFSSEKHKEKFIEKMQENRSIINYSLTRRFNVNIDVSNLADFVLYKKIESRGFLILDNEDKEICQKRMVLSGLEVIIQN